MEKMAVNKKVVIEANRPVGEGLFLMEFLLPELADWAKPGQFVHVLINDQADPLLRRPISLFDIDPAAGVVRLLYKVVGRGTMLMSEKKPNDSVEIMGPLGQGFTIRKNERVVLVGGGVGLAPLVYLARVLQRQGCQVELLHGVSNKSQLLPYFNEPGIEYLAATMDGSEGFTGLVTDLLQERVDPKQCDYIYTCGPEPMMAAVIQYARRWNIPGELSLEEKMACGVGACLGCARRLKPDDEYLVKVCKDGPVFNMTAVEL
jgi:dihydroorotate dehydrogenase electron transfer subunit